MDYGFSGSDYIAAREICDNDNSGDLVPGRIIDCRREQYKIICEYGEVQAELKGSFYYDLKEGEGMPVIGDFVLLIYNRQGPSLISAILPRRSKFSRADFSGHAEAYVKNVREQVIAANFDYVFILSSLNHDLNPGRLARYLTVSWQSGAFPVIVLSKADLVDTSAGDPDNDPGNVQGGRNLNGKIAEVRKLASSSMVVREVPVIPVSSKTGYGIGDLLPFLEKRKTIVLLGSSGVGKSSLLNRLSGEELMEVKAIRDDDSRGRHTTTHRQLFRLASGALVIDTPGLRELGLWDTGDGLDLVFTEVEELFPLCRFSNCTHENEPGCAVLAALEDGRLSPLQWKNYRLQKKEAAFVEDHSAYLKQKREFHKALARMNRARQKGNDEF